MRPGILSISYAPPQRKISSALHLLLLDGGLMRTSMTRQRREVHRLNVDFDVALTVMLALGDLQMWGADAYQQAGDAWRDHRYAKISVRLVRDGLVVYAQPDTPRKAVEPIISQLSILAQFAPRLCFIPEVDAA